MASDLRAWAPGAGPAQPTGSRPTPLSGPPLDLTDLSSPLTETCSAFALSLREGDLDAAERLFGFLVDQMPDLRSVLSDVLLPLARRESTTAEWPLFADSCAALLTRLRRDAAPRRHDRVLLCGRAGGLPTLALHAMGLLLDDSQVPSTVHLDADLAPLRRARHIPVAAVAVDGDESLLQAAPLARSLQESGTSVVVVTAGGTVDRDLVGALGIAALAGTIGEAADLLLLLRGPLTLAEAHALRLAADGYTNVRIAHELGISVSAVKSRLESAFLRLHAADRTHAVAIALRQHWIR